MEPSLDPSQELQAAGRIHRLGQSKEILIKRFAFKDTVETALLALHEAIRAGDIKIATCRQIVKKQKSKAPMALARHSNTCKGSLHTNPRMEPERNFL
mmetsp:Transcript_85151/g.170097  ORF Transcript_85151/g.170097 Transcript_85151/m.170097 type:complete len:98 (+) Transcript_85151:255-548(+)